MSMTPDLLKYAADIISAAAKTPLGIVALFIMVLGVLAHLFFSRSSPESVTRPVFMRPGGDGWRWRVAP